MSLVSLDIETACNVEGCIGFGGYKKCDHALSPWHGKITKIGIIGENQRRVVNLSVGLKSKNLTYVGHNLKFDLLWLAVHGQDLQDMEWHCTQAMSYILTEKVPDWFIEELKQKRKAAGVWKWNKIGKHSLEALAAWFLKVDPSWKWGGKDSDEYVLNDVQYTLDLFYVLEKKLKERNEWDFYLNRQLPYTKMLLEAEIEGAELDMEALEKMEHGLRQKLVHLQNQIDEQWADAHKSYRKGKEIKVAAKYAKMSQARGKFLEPGTYHYKLYQAALEKVPKKLNFASPPQRLWLFRDYLGLDCTKIEVEKDESGKWVEQTKYSTDSEVIERLINQGHEELKPFAEWAEIEKILTTFLPSFREWQVNGVIHFIYNPDITKTGRLSSERPNGQNIPKKLRPLFRARKGKKFTGFDADQIEAKVITVYTSDPTLYNLIQSGTSFHDHNVRVYFGYDTPIAQVKKQHEKERDAVKSVGYSLFYNSGANRVNTVFTRHGYVFGKDKCKQFVTNFRKEYKPVFDVAGQIINHFESGETLPNLLGRPLIVEQKEACFMQAFNKIIQSSASDLCLEGTLRAIKEMRSKGIKVKPIFFVHDFAGLEVDEAQVKDANEILKNNLTGFDLKCELGPVKLTVDGGVMDRWTK